jgi:phosphate transport system protein
MGGYEQRLQKDLARIAKRVKKMGRAVSTSVENAVTAALSRDAQLATETILGDLPTNRLSSELDRRCHVFVARHLPSAGHLRYISSVMRLNQTLERIGDYAETISRAGLSLSSPAPVSTQRDIEMLGEHAVRLLRKSLQSFEEEDVDLARGTHEAISNYGTTFDKIFDDLVAEGESKSRPMADLFALMAIFNRLERVLHQAKNVCQQTVFAVTGETKPRKKFDILFVDSRNAGASVLAEHYARKAYPDAGTYGSAGWDAADAVDPSFVTHGEEIGLDLVNEEPTQFLGRRKILRDYDLIIDLAGGVHQHVRRVPYHTTLLSWPLERRDDPVAVYEQLVPRLSDLMFTLRGEEEEEA